MHEGEDRGDAAQIRPFGKNEVARLPPRHELLLEKDQVSVPVEAVQVLEEQGDTLLKGPPQLVTPREGTHGEARFQQAVRLEAFEGPGEEESPRVSGD